MTIPGPGSPVWATVRDSASEDGSRQGQGAKPHGGAIEGCPTLSRRSLLLQAASLLALYVVAVPSPAMAWGLPKSLPEATVQQMKEEARRDVKAVLSRLDRDLPGVFKKVVGTTGGGALGGGLISLPALWFGGSVTGLSAAGITSGLSAVALGAGMVAGVGVLALPVLGGGIIGYIATARNRRGKTAKKIDNAVRKLKTIEAHLQPSRYFRNEIAQIEADIKKLENQKPKLA